MGMHRVARARIEGQASIRAVRLQRLPEPHFRDCSPADLPCWNTSRFAAQCQRAVGAHPGPG